MLRGTTDRLLEETEFPTTTEEFVERHGDEEFEYPNGTETLAEVLAHADAETFETAEDARLTVYAALSSEAIGRVGYSDRDPTPLGSPYGHDQISF